MRQDKNKGKKKATLRNIIWTLIGIAVIAAVGCFAYIQDYYHADETAIETYMAGVENVTVKTLENGYRVYVPGNWENTAESEAGLVLENDGTSTGVIFYPGGKVEYTAYEPLMAALAERGILGILVEMPGNLAVLDINAADGLQEQFPEITSWYMAGHSLGGSMAASYLSEHTDTFDGLILLGAYSTADLAASGLKVLSLYGSEDQILNREKYEKYRGNLPDDFSEIVIEGGNHAGFGMYGAQDGDGSARITNEEQIEKAAGEIAVFVRQ